MCDDYRDIWPVSIEDDDAEKPTLLLIPAVFGDFKSAICDYTKSLGFAPHYLPPITDADINTGYASIDNDVCVSTVAIIGQYIRYFASEAYDEAIPHAVLAPELCAGCRASSLDAVLSVVLKRTRLDQVRIVPLDNATLTNLVQRHAVETTANSLGDAMSPSAPSLDNPDTPLHGASAIGLCGTVPAIAVPLFHQVVNGTITRSGYQVALPPLAALVGQRDVVEPAIRHFAQQGITHAVCLLPFGCLSGHVFGRGQLRELAKRYPGIALTILDYDPSASDINLVNRTELVIQSMRESALHPKDLGRIGRRGGYSASNPDT